MSAPNDPRIAIIGGGPAGSLLAILLARRGLKPVVIERGRIVHRARSAELACDPDMAERVLGLKVT